MLSPKLASIEQETIVSMNLPSDLLLQPPILEVQGVVGAYARQLCNPCDIQTLFDGFQTLNLIKRVKTPFTSPLHPEPLRMQDMYF